MINATRYAILSLLFLVCQDMEGAEFISVYTSVGITVICKEKMSKSNISLLPFSSVSHVKFPDGAPNQAINPSLHMLSNLLLLLFANRSWFSSVLPQGKFRNNTSNHVETASLYTRMLSHQMFTHHAWSSSVPTGKCSDSISNQATIAHLHFFFHHSFSILGLPQHQKANASVMPRITLQQFLYTYFAVHYSVTIIRRYRFNNGRS